MPLVIIAGGSGQHAAVVYEAAVLSGESVAGFAAAGEGEPPGLLDCRYLGHVDKLLKSFAGGEVEYVIACGSNSLRRQVAERLRVMGLSLRSVQHPSAILSPSAMLAPGCMLLAGSIVGPSASLGQCVIMNHSSSVDHNCVVGDYVNISPGARLGGAANVEQGAFVGLNACILPGRRIGEASTVGAGALVTTDVEPNCTVTGVPARPHKSG